jgi:hypothetical protein
VEAVQGDVDVGGGGWTVIHLKSLREHQRSWRDGRKSGEKQKHDVDEFVAQQVVRCLH